MTDLQKLMMVYGGLIFSSYNLHENKYDKTIKNKSGIFEKIKLIDMQLSHIEKLLKLENEDEILHESQKEVYSLL